MIKKAMNTDAVLTKLVNEYNDINGKKKELEAQLEGVKTKLAAKLSESGLEAYFCDAGDGYASKIYQYYNVSAATDKDLAKKLLGADYDRVFYQKTSSNLSLSIARILKVTAMEELAKES